MFSFATLRRREPPCVREAVALTDSIDTKQAQPFQDNFATWLARDALTDLPAGAGGWRRSIPTKRAGLPLTARQTARQVVFLKDGILAEAI
ncbi:hypothetical protein DKQ62_07160 [Halomonas elongata]|nr:hypothetical protein DKQ62_07160 [Halomonas elongata]